MSKFKVGDRAVFQNKENELDPWNGVTVTIVEIEDDGTPWPYTMTVDDDTEAGAASAEELTPVKEV